MSWDAFNQSAYLIAQVEAYKQRFGFTQKPCTQIAFIAHGTIANI